jgi:acetyl esterase/lipase
VKTPSALALPFGLLAAAACVSAQGNPPLDAVRSACRADLERYCSAALASGDRRAAGLCLRENRQSLSQECRGALRSLREARQEDAPPARGGAAPPPAAARAATAAQGKIVSYGADAKQKLRLFPASAGSGETLVIFVHGGGWAKGDMDTGNGAKSAAFNAAGHSFATLNYRLYPAADVAQQAGDVAQGIAAAIGAMRESGREPQRVVLIGHSAGAHLAALVALDDRYLGAAGLAPGRIDGVALLDGAGYDVASQVEMGGNAALYRTIFGTDRSRWAALSPLTYAAGGADGPAFLIHYVAGRDASRRQSEALAGAIRRSGGTAEVRAAAGKTHATINKELGLPGDQVTAEVLDFVAGSGKPPLQ